MQLRGSREMDDEVSFWQLMKRSKIDYVIIILAFLLVASNQVFETTPLRASGTIEITSGSAIPQDSNYTLTSITSPAISSAIILNETFEKSSLYVDIAVDAINKTICNTCNSPHNVLVK